MRIPFRSRMILPALLALLLVPSVARSDEEKPKAKIQKRPVAQEPAQAGTQTQTAPAAGSEKGKEKAAPGEAGLSAIQGKVVQVYPDRHAIIVRTTTKDYQIYVTPQTVLLRDGQPVELEAIQPGDRVDSCHFNAKNAIQKMSIASPGKAATIPPPAPGKP